jgi:hypothetical protein
MAATQFGTSLQLGAGTTLTGPTITNIGNYIIESATNNEAERDEEKTYDASGAVANIAQFGKYPTVTATLICKTGADPVADFPVGTVVNTNWMVDAAPITKTKSPHRVQIRLVQYGLAAL